MLTGELSDEAGCPVEAHGRCGGIEAGASLFSPAGTSRLGVPRTILAALAALAAIGGVPTSAEAVDPAVLFGEAVRHELEGGAAAEAFALYRQAAQTGFAEAEFNVAVMYDSGRGVARDVAMAATWYARAATRGNLRAAYNLGQLYEAGEGVPQNADLSRSWFALSDLAAARDRLTTPRLRPPSTAVLSAPVLIAPGAGSTSAAGSGGLELVWTSRGQPEPVRFFVELRAIDTQGSHEVFSGFTDTSGVLAPVPDVPGDYAWRVSAVAREANRYGASGWQHFSVVPQ